MKRYVALLFSLALMSQAVHAEEAKEPSFWEKLRMKIEQLTPQKKLSPTTAVGGVRGAPVEANDIYWKGEAAAIDATELAAFQKALALAEGGKKAEAQAAFAEFAKTYPDSPLRKDAEQALAQLQAK